MKDNYVLFIILYFIICLCVLLLLSLLIAITMEDLKIFDSMMFISIITSIVSTIGMIGGTHEE